MNPTPNTGSRIGRLITKVNTYDIATNCTLVINQTNNYSMSPAGANYSLINQSLSVGSINYYVSCTNGTVSNTTETRTATISTIYYPFLHGLCRGTYSQTGINCNDAGSPYNNGVHIGDGYDTFNQDVKGFWSINISDLGSGQIKNATFCIYQYYSVGNQYYAGGTYPIGIGDINITEINMTETYLNNSNIQYFNSTGYSSTKILVPAHTSQVGFGAQWICINVTDWIANDTANGRTSVTFRAFPTIQDSDSQFDYIKTYASTYQDITMNYFAYLDVNITYEMDITWNTPANNSFTINLSSILWNATISETPDTCILNINGTANYSMLISGNYCYYTTSNLTNQTTYCGLIYANNSIANVSGVQCATVNLTSYVPPAEELTGMALLLSDAGTGLGGFLGAITDPIVGFVLLLGIVSGMFMIFYGLAKAITFTLSQVAG